MKYTMVRMHYKCNDNINQCSHAVTLTSEKKVGFETKSDFDRYTVGSSSFTNVGGLTEPVSNHQLAGLLLRF